MVSKLSQWAIHNKTRILIATVLVCLSLSARLIPGPRTIDDAFITFRYARNILAGSGFVFNPGERVLGTTTPAFTLLLVFLGFFTGGPAANFPLISTMINAGFDAATCLLLWRLGKNFSSEHAGIATGLVWSIAPFSVAFAIGGLETSFYVFLLVAVMVAHLDNKHTLAAFLGIIAILTRPDAVLLIAPLAIDRLIQILFRNERIQLGELLALFLPAVAWGTFATLYFGSPIPHSVLAKMQVYRLEPYSALIRLIQHYATPFLENNWAGPVGIGIGLFAYPTLFIIGAFTTWRKTSRAWPWIIYPWLYLVVFSIPNPLIFRWYLTPPLPAYFLFILIGLYQILRRLFKSQPTSSIFSWRNVLPILILFAFPLGSTLTDWRLRPDHGNSNPAPDMAFIQLELLYQKAAEFVTPQLAAGDRLAAGDVGVLGYFTGARILDTVGLNSPESLKYFPEKKENYVINYAIPTGLILGEQPDWIVILEVYGRRTFLMDAQFNKIYKRVETIPTDMYGSHGLLIFHKLP